MSSPGDFVKIRDSWLRGLARFFYNSEHVQHDRVLADDQTGTLPGAPRYIYSQVSAQEAHAILDGDVARVLAGANPLS